jgi:hypothetical protein
VSRGPDRIERAIRALFDAHPDEAFTTDDLCEHCYPADRPVERQHRGVALRAAKKVIEVDPDWRLTWSWTLGNTLIFYNQASLSGAVMADVLRWEATSSRKRVLDQTSRVLASETEWLRGRRESCEHRVRQHIAVRDADPAERERLIGQRTAEGTKLLAEAAQAIRAAAGRPAQALSSPDGDLRDLPTTLTSLALQARALIAMNDPDVVRVGLAEIADALDALGRP